MNISYFDEHSICHVNYEDVMDTKNSNKSFQTISPTNFQESMSFISLENEALNDHRVHLDSRDKSDDSDSSNNGIELEHVKHKLSSLWNNVKYGIFKKYIIFTIKKYKFKFFIFLI